ncbi:MAG TPA: hypothetical protein VMS71_05265, partial [Candidatus Acidoferrum sp.]|nr:hypothetical protein [Candidatus Acidoferrum sp.]
YLLNKWAGVIHDKNDSLPGSIKKDSLDIYVTYPNGSGGTSTKLYHADASGQFQLDSIPAGRQALKIVYLPSDDTLMRYATVLPRQKINNPKLYKLASSFSAGSDSSSSYLTKVAGSDSVYSSGCTSVCFWIANNTGSSKTISSIKLSWPSPTAYYATIYWDNTIVFNKAGSPRGVSGTTYSFSAGQTIADGQQVRIRIADFASHNSNGGGGNENMTNANLSVLFSDGSSLSAYSGACY